jgi:hypothetical protein
MHFCALVGRIKSNEAPRGSLAQAYVSIVTQRDRLDKSSLRLSLDAAQPWVLTLLSESDAPDRASTAACLNRRGAPEPSMDFAGLASLIF